MNTNEYLKEHGINPSVQRIALMNYLLTHKTHPNVEEMYCALHPEIPTLSRTTIYNTMKLFVEHGVALLIGIEEKNVRFDGDTSVHGHFLCQKCGELYDFRFDETNLILQKQLSGPLNGYSITDTQVYCKGTCNDCK